MLHKFLVKPKKQRYFLNLLKINALIVSKVGLGKNFGLFILLDAPIIDASIFKKFPKLNHFLDIINRYLIRVVAKLSQSLSSEYMDKNFNVKFDMAPLRDRVENVALLS